MGLYLLFGTFCTNTLHDIFGVFGLEAFGQRDGGNLNGGEAVGAMATYAGEMDVARAMLCVVMVAETVFLCPCSIVDFVKQMCLGESGEGAEQCAAIDGRQCCLEVSERKGILKVTSDGFQN